MNAEVSPMVLAGLLLGLIAVIAIANAVLTRAKRPEAQRRLKMPPAIPNVAGPEPEPEPEPESPATGSPFGAIRQLVQSTRQQHHLASDGDAFTYLVLRQILGLQHAAITQALTGGAHTGGISALHVDRKGAQAKNCDYPAGHIVACDYVESVADSKRPIPRERVDRIADSWVAIASSNDEHLKRDAALRRQIGALHAYWENIENDVPHQIYIATNRERAGIDRARMEKKMNYFASHEYHYLEQADVVRLLLPDPSGAVRGGRSAS